MSEMGFTRKARARGTWLEALTERQKILVKLCALKADDGEILEAFARLMDFCAPLEKYWCFLAVEALPTGSHGRGDLLDGAGRHILTGGKMRLRIAIAALTYAICSVVLSATFSSARAEEPLDRLSNILIVYMENHSFDNLFGEYPGVEGIANAETQVAQTDKNGMPYRRLPPAKAPFVGSDNPPSLRAVEALVG
ncbi:hypothetical protein LMG27198_43570 [Methylocystis echinoides]|uniref:Acid phosphatase n=1 Tax=Methylocystis echinoides TaxID=29468 RepID=A0A9W6GYR9_9HYPH|nr:hypothetical protein LMG27198_43570 [Methylocystis echinoides]